MKRINGYGGRGMLLLLAGLAAWFGAAAQDRQAVLMLKLAYFDIDNGVPSLRVTALEKRDGRLSPVAGLPLRLFLGDSSGGGVIGAVVTDVGGRAVTGIPAVLRGAWKSAGVLHFMAVSAPFKDLAAKTAEIDISRSRLSIDTLAGGDGSRTVTALLQEWKDGRLSAVKGADIKIGIRRLGSYLAVGDEEAYTTDSTGRVAAVFKKMQLPGDAKGNLTITARVEDNDSLGNVRVSQTVPWGIAGKADDFGFGRRSIWATNDRAPWPLMTVAYSLIAAVWLVLLYLVRKIWQIRRMGRAES